MSWQGIHGPVHLLVPVAAAPRLRQWGPKRGANPKRVRPTGPPPASPAELPLERCSRQPWGLGPGTAKARARARARARASACLPLPQPFGILVWHSAPGHARATSNFRKTSSFPITTTFPPFAPLSAPPSLPNPISNRLAPCHDPFSCSIAVASTARSLSLLVFDTRLGRAPSADFLRTLVAPPVLASADPGVNNCSSCKQLRLGLPFPLAPTQTTTSRTTIRPAG